jgi:hypothetical protein
MSKVTIYQQACKQVDGFKEMGEHFMRNLVINGRSRSTHENYLRQMAKLALHCKKSPLELEPVELEEYLYDLMQEGKTTSSLSEFKHLVYGLRKLYLLNGLDSKHIVLPSIAHSKALPVVLSQDEVKRLLHAPKHLWERVFYGMAYDTGMRISELVYVHISDVDLQRKQVHIRQSKFKKDRYVAISEHLAAMYNLLFSTAWSVLNSFGNTKRWLGGKIGATAILHTWGQNLWFHPHVHFIVPAGALMANGKWKNSRSRGKYLFKVEQLSDVFRARFTEQLRKLHKEKSESTCKEEDRHQTLAGNSLRKNGNKARSL